MGVVRPNNGITYLDRTTPSLALPLLGGGNLFLVSSDIGA
jgi:hypothetical protein